MIVHDRVYSTFTIDSPIALELISSKPFQRLKHISQLGLPPKYHHLEGYSRYDHSIGVYHLLSKMGAAEEEQVAGLLHDVSHTAFSHLIDLVIGDGLTEDYQDNRHLSVLQQEDIASVLRNYGFTPEYIADYHRFGLLERDIPDVCADRIDYVLRESPHVIAERCLPYLQAFNGEIVFLKEENALLFANNFLDRQENHWAGYEGITRYVIFSNMLKRALADQTITIDDLHQTDEFVINKIIKSNVKEHCTILRLMEHKDLSFLPKASKPTMKKFRYVDPKVMVDRRVAKLSSINRAFFESIERAKERNLKGTYAGVYP
jgi:HD superfamily phosphohydrolase